jgi:hypothetical protein
MPENLMPQPAENEPAPIPPMKRSLIEGVFAFLFVSGILGADRFLEPTTPAPVIAAFLLVMALILTAWFGSYVIILRRLDELMRALEVQSLAISCGITMWFLTLWGVASFLTPLPDLPLIFIAPLTAGVYGAVRFVLAIAYR